MINFKNLQFFHFSTGDAKTRSRLITCEGIGIIGKETYKAFMTRTKS